MKEYLIGFSVTDQIQIAFTEAVKYRYDTLPVPVILLLSYPGIGQRERKQVSTGTALCTVQSAVQYSIVQHFIGRTASRIESIR